MIDPISPASNALGGTGPIGGLGAATGSASSSAVNSALPSDFTDLLSQMASKAVETMKGGEAMAISGIKGQASVQEVVEAMMASERTLQTAIAVRDKAVSAYLELSRMSI